MGSCAAPSAKGDDKFITTDYLQQCPAGNRSPEPITPAHGGNTAAADQLTEIQPDNPRMRGEYY
ncbi:hypothetical protein EYB55_27750 (plasmid) [Klebsiella pneumoniae]|nr:hypothetical protein EYB55_27750 [Klebsiella pneumoniae]